jgi:predicted transcriptional regulator of viral defense system
VPQCDEPPATFTYAEAMAAGLTKHRLYAMRNAGLIEPIARGLYRHTQTEEAIDLDLIEIARRVPHATLSLTSALAHHQLTDAIPAAIDVALPRGAHRPAITARVAWHQFDRHTFDIGRDTIEVTGRTGIGIYSAERSIIDAFRLRHREGDELAYGALRRWLRRPGNSPGALHDMTRQHFPKTAKAVKQALEIFQYE